MLNDVTVIAWGEFGSTPRINKDAGRDHWPQVSGALLTGGGMRGGQVIGSTNRLGENAETRPVHFQEIVATLYRNLGINPLSKPAAGMRNSAMSLCGSVMIAVARNSCPSCVRT